MTISGGAGLAPPEIGASGSAAKEQQEVESWSWIVPPTRKQLRDWFNFVLLLIGFSAVICAITCSCWGLRLLITLVFQSIAHPAVPKALELIDLLTLGGICALLVLQIVYGVLQIGRPLAQGINDTWKGG